MLLELIINLFTVTINFIAYIFSLVAYVVELMLTLIWKNLFQIIITSLRKNLFIFFRYSSLGYKTEDKINVTKKILKKKSRFDKNKIMNKIIGSYKNK